MLDITNDLLDILLTVESDEYENTLCEEPFVEPHIGDNFFGWCLERYYLNDDTYYEGAAL